jgi:hypothetical protein
MYHNYLSSGILVYSTTEHGIVVQPVDEDPPVPR